MKKYIIALSIGLTSFVMNAQNGQGDHKPDPQKQTAKMTTELGLSDDQKTKVLALNTEEAQKIETLRANNTDKKTFRAEKQKVEQDRETKLKVILTDDQFKKFLQVRAEQKEKRKEMRQQN